MIERLLEITGSPEFEERGRMRLAAALWEQRRLRLEFEVDGGNGGTTRWELAFDGVLEEQLSGAYQCGLNVWYADHPAVDQYTAQQESLAFTGPAADADRAVGQLWAVHRELTDDWIPFDRYFDEDVPLRELLLTPSGVLASGPAFLIGGYAAVLERNGCKTGRAGAPRPGRVERACMVHFDESFVVAEAVTARMLGRE